ncbi:polymer-forming cytoskeletal protein [Brevibacillus ruminantium]|uniref:Polymer-forming cytoskeletal protein n=1 Tax=Brevibacillus ruminantium TaxID=2950604 RepID=A0ABY4WGI9_9BACL|nr:polymer-forming cytoskeletal protein [Brevibacillus ruminantium]USG65243.1 polymer-forming cytoskeletal protein [Brevibacillus ruminantium]
MKRLCSLLLLVTLLFMGTAAFAFTGISEERFHLAADVVHRGDLAVYSTNTVIEGVVDGDLYVFSQNVQIKGHVTGDLLSFAAATIVSGQIDGNIRSLADTLFVTGKVAGSVTSISNHMRLEKDSKIGKNLLLLASQADLGGEVDREVNGMVENIGITGRIGEGISKLHAMTLSIDAPAEIGGDLVYSSPQRAVIGPGAVLKGKEDYSYLEDLEINLNLGYLPLFLAFASLLSTLLLWLAIRFLFPAGLTGIYRQLDLGKGSTYVWGTCLVLGIPLLMILLWISLIGIPVGLILLSVFLILTWLAKVFVGAWLGIRLTERFHWKSSPLLAELLGVIALQCLLLIPLLGWLMALPVWVAFFGALAGAVIKTNKTFLP